jgi:hypothetical protein
MYSIAKFAKGKARKSAGMRRIFLYAATTTDAAHRCMWQFPNTGGVL